MVAFPRLLTSLQEVDRHDRDIGDSSSGEAGPAPDFALLTDSATHRRRFWLEIKALLQRAPSRSRDAEPEVSFRESTPVFFFIGRAVGMPEKACGWDTSASVGSSWEFNALLRGGSRACFSEIVGETAILPSIKYVITLDTDTQLPREGRSQLVGTMAHPVEPSVFDATRGIVAEGYSILQPRVGVSPARGAEIVVCPAFCRRRGH